MSDIIDINVAQTVEEVTINVTEEVIQVNINQVNGGGGIESIEAGDNISVDNTDPDNPIVSATGLVPYVGATSDVNLGEFGLLTGNLEFDNTPTDIPTNSGSVYYNDTDGTLDLILKGSNVKLQIGQEQVVRVVNKTATNINLLQSNYQAVRVTGAQGQRMKVDLAQATNDLLSAETIGLVTETINNNQEGFITTSGLVRNINTTGSLQSETETWADGDILYLSPTVAGSLTNVKPVAPNHLVVMGYVISAHATQGSIFVKVDNGYELDELHNVKIDTPLNNQGLVYNSTLQVWENKKIDLESVTTAGKTTTKGVTLLVPTSGDSLDSSLIVKLNSGGYTNGLIAGHRQSSGDRTGFISLMNVENFEQTTLDYEKLNFLSDTKDIKFLLDKTKANGNYTIATTSDIPSPITIDATPTDGSSNAVSSNGVFDALDTNFEKAIFRNISYAQPSGFGNTGSANFNFSPNLTSWNFIYQGNTATGAVNGFVRFNTTAIAGALAFRRRHDGISLGAVNYSYTQKLRFETNLTGQRGLYGLSTQYQFGAPTNVEPNTITEVIGVCQLSTSTNLHVIHNDSSGLATTIDLGSDYPCNTNIYTYYINIVRRIDLSNFVVKVTRVTNSDGSEISVSNTIVNNFTTFQLQSFTWITNNAQASVATYFDGGFVAKLLNE